MPPKVFGKIKVAARNGRGEGCDGMLEDYIQNKYDESHKVFTEEATESEKQAVIDKLNEVSDGLGEAFRDGKDAFSGASTDILNHEAFFEAL